MRNKDMLKKMPVKCITAIMIATMSMTPVAATLAFPITAYAAHLDDNPEGSMTSIAEGDTMDNNWGIISSNEGTLNNNEGTVINNSGTVENNWGDVTNSASGSVETNHTSGNVTNGNITDNYGIAHNSEVANNFTSGTVTGSDSRVTDNFGQADAIGQVTNNYGTAIDTDVVTNYERGTVTKQGETEVYVSDNYAEPSHIGDGVTLSDEEGYGQHEVVAGPNAGKSTQADPQPTAPVPVQDPVPASTHEEPAQAPAPDPAPAPTSDPTQEPTQDTWSEIPPESPSAAIVDIIDVSDIVEKAQIIAKLNTATWDKNQIVLADGTVLTVADLATLECAVLASDIVTQADLTGVYETIFVNAIASNGGSVKLAREEALKVVTALKDSLTEDMPSNYTPERVAKYKATYIKSFLEWVAKGETLSKAQAHAKKRASKLSNNWEINDLKNVPDTQPQPQTAAVTSANAATAIAPVNTDINPNVYTIDTTSPGGTANISVGTSIDATLATAIYTRRDITIEVIYDLDGIRSRTTIPAGADVSFLNSIITEEHRMPIEVFAAHFGSTSLP